MVILPLRLKWLAALSVLDWKTIAIQMISSASFDMKALSLCMFSGKLKLGINSNEVKATPTRMIKTPKKALRKDCETRIPRKM